MAHVPAAEAFAFQGRTAAEYERFFDLDPARWDAVLDCGAGPGSFAAETGDATDVVAVDPAYADPPATLRVRTAESAAKLRAGLPEMADQFVWSFYEDVDDRLAYLERAHERFLADVATAPGRYVAGGLPDLPLADDAVDLALVAHLLFMYEDELDERFHREALLELCRVAREEVRVYPLHTLAGPESEYVEPAVGALAAAGHDVERRSVDFAFQPGSAVMLVVTPS